MTINDIPSEQWTLEQLGQQAKLLLEETAEIAWKLGRIFIIAKAKCKHGQWGKWQKANLPRMSATTIGRYRKVAGLPFEEVRGKQLQEVYRILGIIDDADDAEEAEVVETPLAATTTPLSATTTSVTPEPVEQEEDFGPDAEDHAHIIDDIDAKVEQIVSAWPQTTMAIKRACLDLSDALDLPELDVETAVKLLVQAMTRPALAAA
ncbi:hypothetical protein [Limnoglobus roseus]|uniref:DUF3102 domain-containing protein n=1 Tax=Limnoglobus roseus TaxID=2598579 RepID=A0A5C1AF88_9BACT|nr:hypothetical protein [Limnoglobus roseus]QEL15804.1 hypothetical protein PX52LOC_02740 [Limnoglobus roseus]